MSNKKIDFSQLTVEIEEKENEIVYIFKGDVNENFIQNRLPIIPKERMVIDLAQVENFNSCGTREWIFFVKSLTEVSKVVFRRCSIATIDQINMIPDSLGSAVIESFYAPYYCPEHGESIQLIEVSKCIEQLKRGEAPEFLCKNCNKPLEFDALEESYFMFINEISEESKAS